MVAFASSAPLTVRRHRPQTFRIKACERPPRDAEQQTSDSTRRTLSRRALLRLVSGAGLVGTSFVMYHEREQLRYISPAALLSELGIRVAPLRAATSGLSGAREFIEKRDKDRDFHIPDFATGDWINSRPLSLNRELEHKVVLLDFFTYCCVNCMHVLPKLAQLERMYDPTKGFAVVGVHSAKFSAERDTQNIAAAVARYDVTHPVLNDEKMAMWGALGVSSWPTLALVGPRGNLLAMWQGEASFDDVAAVVDAALEYYGDTLSRTALPVAPLTGAVKSWLRYPGKLGFGDDASLFVADTANHRVVQLACDDGVSARVLRTLGSGGSGFSDGDSPTFHAPQGVCVSDGVLYVADTGNHAVRAVDLKTGTTTTLGGDGTRGLDYKAGFVGRKQTMASPWDVVVVDRVLYVAMAGTHQLWALPLDAPHAWTVVSGTGRESEMNASDARRATWAQPSGLAYAGKDIVVADSESSSIRAYSLVGEGTRTLAGGDATTAGNLFAFGDRDGRARSAKFQHPLAVAHDVEKNLTYVADSFNHRIKCVDARGVATSIAGDGKPGFRDGAGRGARFWEPAGLALSKDATHLYVADTNNGVVRMIDLQSRVVSTLTIEGATIATNQPMPLIANRARATVSTIDESVSPNAVVSFDIRLPDDSHFTPGATSLYQSACVSASNYEVLRSGSGDITMNDRRGQFTIDLGAAGAKSGDAVEVESILYYCGDADGICRADAQVFQLSLGDDTSKRHVAISRTVVRKQRRAVSFERT